MVEHNDTTDVSMEVVTGSSSLQQPNTIQQPSIEDSALITPIHNDNDKNDCESCEQLKHQLSLERGTAVKCNSNQQDEIKKWSTNFSKAESSHLAEIARYEQHLQFLTDQLFVAKGSFWVVVRLYAPDISDILNSNVLLSSKNPQVVEVRDQAPSRGNKIYSSFSYVFPPTSINSQVWEALRPMVSAMLNLNTCHINMIVADGQSGSGKSHTMFRGSDNIVSMLSSMLFAELKRRKLDYSISVATVEVYGRAVYDRGIHGNGRKFDRVQMNEAGYQQCPDADSLKACIARARANTHNTATHKNLSGSSRGHFVTQIQIDTAIKESSLSRYDAGNRVNGYQELTRSIFLVDLAGAEEQVKHSELWPSSSEKERLDHAQAQHQLEEERRSILDGRHDFLELLRLRDTKELKCPNKTLGKLLRLPANEAEKIVFIACIKLVGPSDPKSQRMAADDLAIANSLAIRSMKKVK